VTTQSQPMDSGRLSEYDLLLNATHVYCQGTELCLIAVVLLLDSPPKIQVNTKLKDRNGPPPQILNDTLFGFYRALYPRGPIARSSWEVEFSDVYKPRYRGQNSTADALRSWLGKAHSPASPDHMSTDPLHVLHWIIYQDSVGMFCVINETLNTIQTGLLQDHLVEANANHWSRLVRQCEMYVLEIADSLGQLSTFVNPQADAHYQVVARDVSSQMQQLVVSTTERLKTLNRSLSNIMGILESRRGIAEAESVTRLTEFAFFFIPITLTAGVLSMQVIELKNGVPLWAFFTISFSLIYDDICNSAFDWQPDDGHVHAELLASGMREQKKANRACK
jgi:hypothetical protein